MAMHEPLLNRPLTDWEQETQQAFLLGLENSDAVCLGNIPDTRACKKPLRGDGCESVEGIVDNPVEHFYQKGKLLEEATVYVVPEPGRVWSFEDHATAITLLGRILGSRDGNVMAVIGLEGQ